MINPVTSTKVATKGAEDVAGSAPKRFNINGNIEPDKDPQSTTPTKATPTVSAISIQCGPYISVNCAQAKIRRKPIAPSANPSKRPD